LNTLYQFWIHTRLVKRLPAPLEWVLNTPSHHRVHHGVNPKYIDKNYGGIFIVWDRLLGTFREEDEEPVYGTVKPLASWNPLWANAHYWVEMAEMSRLAPRLVDKRRVWVAPPEWRPRELSGGLGYVTIPEVSRDAQKKYATPRVSRGLKAYLTAHFFLAAAATGAVLLFAKELPEIVLATTTALILVELAAWGALFEGKSWGVPLAVLRIAATLVAVVWFTRGSGAATIVAATTAVVSIGAAVWLLRARQGSREVAAVPAI
jgi:alkylglycerol monooxygenase